MPTLQPKDTADIITVTVVYIIPSAVNIEQVRLHADATIREAISQSGLLTRYLDIDLSRNRVGIFGKLCTLDDNPTTGDRIEIYRPLQADPKESRRRRANKTRSKRLAHHQ